jgi:hypothetical protein
MFVMPFVHGISGKREVPSLLVRFYPPPLRREAVFVYGACAPAACSTFMGVGYMNKDKQTVGVTPLAAKAEECTDLILLHSKERMLRVKGPFEPAHKAYMSLALAASEAIKAFIALDESLK